MREEWMHTLARMLMGAESIDGVADSEAGLIRSSLDGDQEAFAALVRKHQSRVFRLAGRFFRRSEEVEEVAQETFLRAWRKLGTYRADAPFEHWLTRLCLRCAYDRLRQRKGEPEALEIDVESPAPDPDARMEVAKLLAHLSPADRFVLMLLDGEGWSVAEIAERLGWTRVNVKVRAHRARKRLRRLLEEG
jgi:RNA polymerase sigma-70 factor (ECF subfamily)